MNRSYSQIQSLPNPDHPVKSQHDSLGITTTEGKHWKDQRDFLSSHLTHLTGFGLCHQKKKNHDEDDNQDMWTIHDCGFSAGDGCRGFEDVIMDEVKIIIIVTRLVIVIFIVSNVTLRVLISHCPLIYKSHGFSFDDLKVHDLKREFSKKEGEPLTLSYKINVKRHEHDHIVYRHDHNHGHGLQVLVLNVLWSVTCGRKLHPQQQEFQVMIIKIILIRIVI